MQTRVIPGVSRAEIDIAKYLIFHLTEFFMIIHPMIIYLIAKKLIRRTNNHYLTSVIQFHETDLIICDGC